MPAYFDSGFTVNTPSWHGQENLLDTPPTNWAEARKAGGFEWEPVRVPVYEPVGMSECGQHEHYEPIEGFQRIIRDDTGATLCAGPDTLPTIGHGEMGEVIEEILKTPNVVYETGGVLEGGKKVWALALLDEPIKIKGDFSETLPYIAFQNRHDGKGAFSVQATAVRIVCANTWKAAELEGERTGYTYSFRHTPNWRDKVEQAREAVTAARQSINTYVEMAEHLLTVKVTKAQQELFVAEFFPAPPKGVASDRVLANVEKSRQKMRDILVSDTTAKIAGTAYGLVQAAGEYLDHARASKSWETQINRTLLSNEKLKYRALAIAEHVTATKTTTRPRRSRAKADA